MQRRVVIRLQDVAVGSPFWYRRLSEISLLISLLLLAIFGVSMASGENIEAAMQIPLFVAVAACANATVAAMALVFGKEDKTIVWGAASFGTLVILIGLLVSTTGAIFSPYVALWMLVAVFSGLFGIYGLFLLVLATSSFITWQVLNPAPTLTDHRLIMFTIATSLPLAVSYIIWHKKSKHENHGDKAVSALTRQLTEVANKSEIVINSIADGVLAVDNKGLIQLINPAAQALVGWGGADASGLHYESVLKLVNKREQPLPRTENPLEHVKTTKQALVNNELMLVSKSGKKMNVSLVVSPVLQDGEVVAVIVVARDITTEKAHEREQAEFISTASHEMRTPVASIEGYLGLAMNPATANVDDKALLYLGKAQEAVQHLGRLFQDLLTVSRAEDGRLQTHPIPTDIVAFMGTVAESLAPKATAKGLELRFSPYFDRPNDGSHNVTPIFYANVDRDHLREVAYNLVENAIKYTSEGKIVVDVTGDNKLVTISVKDSGIGIPAEDISHLFQKFYRVDNSDTREIGGTGLGLYICRRLVESMRGRIWAESEMGKGSTFFVSLERVSNLEIKNMQQSKAIEELQKTNEVKSTPQPQTAAPAAQAATLPPQPVQSPQTVISDIQPNVNRGQSASERGSLSIPGRR